MKMLCLSALAWMVLFSGCANHSSPEATSESGAMDKAPLTEQAAVTGTSVQQMAVERKLIKEGRVTFQTQHVDQTRNKVDATTRRYAGYVANEHESKYDDRIAYELTIRVPAQHFDALLAGITEGVENFDEKQIEVKDVTEEFTDATVRLRTKKELEKRYLELLQKANSVKDMLEVEREMGNLRTEIEAVEGRLKYLNNQVSYATLSVSYYQKIATQAQFGQAFSEGFRNGWRNLGWFLVGLVNVWPFLLLTAASVLVIRRMIRNRIATSKIK